MALKQQQKNQPSKHRLRQFKIWLSTKSRHLQYPRGKTLGYYCMQVYQIRSKTDQVVTRNLKLPDEISSNVSLCSAMCGAVQESDTNRTFASSSFHYYNRIYNSHQLRVRRSESRRHRRCCCRRIRRALRCYNLLTPFLYPSVSSATAQRYPRWGSFFRNFRRLTWK